MTLITIKGITENKYHIGILEVARENVLVPPLRSIIWLYSVGNSVMRKIEVTQSAITLSFISMSDSC